MGRESKPMNEDQKKLNNLCHTAEQKAMFAITEASALTDNYGDQVIVVTSAARAIMRSTIISLSKLDRAMAQAVVANFKDTLAAIENQLSRGEEDE